MSTPSPKELILTRALTACNAAVSDDDERLAREWRAAKSPFAAWANRVHPSTVARRAPLIEAAQQARTELAAYKSRRQGGGLVLNTAGRPQATLARATANGISVDPTKTLEQLTAQAIRGSQINRPAKGSKKVHPA